jgi:hypothetical protein
VVDWKWLGSDGNDKGLEAALKGPFTSSIKSEYSSELIGWIKEILDGAVSSSVSVTSHFEDLFI